MSAGLILAASFFTSLSASADPAPAASPAYGSEPWLWWGDAVANRSSTVTSSSGKHRFTVLTPSLLRLEFSPNSSFVDGKTLPIWNRALPVPPFEVSTLNGTLTIDTGALVLVHVDDGAPFSDASLSVTRTTPALWSNSSTTWTPSQVPAVDAGQLFGTFHTLDGGHNGYESGGLNCTLLDPNAFGSQVADYVPCDFGLLSKGGFSVVDDSRTPVWDVAAGWLKSRDGSVCPAPGEDQAPCFAGGWDSTDAEMCNAVGCCSQSAPVSLNLFYSKERDDHFTDNANCSACTGLDYVFLHAQGAIQVNPEPGLVALNLYWNENPSSVGGAGGDNVASSFPPAQPGYTFSRVEGYIADPDLPQPPDTFALKLWYSVGALDHWTTSSAADEAAAAAAGYVLVGLVGYASSAPPPPASKFSCAAPSRVHSANDMYLFGHGLDYRAALKDYVAIAGPVALPRRHWMGVSWSTWDESNTDEATREQMRNLTGAGYPVDTYIFDMQWHKTPAWGGYEWDTARYPDVPGLLSFLHSFNVSLGMNLHDADGVVSRNNGDAWPAFAHAMGLNTTSGAAPFAIGNKTYADALAQFVIAPLLGGDGGLDMCWTDWQQGFPGVSNIAGLVPTAMLNHYRFYSCSPAAGTRGTIHSRYAGRGDHRHTSHFGGDVDETWASLAFMVDFTKTAANAPACWWGHEMMRNGGGINDSSELFVRTNQFGAWSPIFTSWGNSGENNQWWDMPEPFASALRESLRDREQLIPLRYTLAADATITGLCPVRGMHFGAPLEESAYDTPGQYMLGENLIVAPALGAVSNPPIPPTGGSAGGTVNVRVWVPAGDIWRDFNSPNAAPVASGWISYNATIFQVPVLVRSGSVVGLLPRNLTSVVGIASQQYSRLVFRVFPGAPAGGTLVYEDDGLSTDYMSGVSATTKHVYRADGACVTHTISTTGSYSGMITQGRVYALELVAAGATGSVTLNGVELTQAAGDGVAGTWCVVGEQTNVYTREVTTADVVTVTVCQRAEP